MGRLRDEQTRAPWEPDTMAIVFSTTKGMTAVALAVAHSQGLFEWDDPVAKYWPEFAQNGKAAITVRQLLSHQAGLSAVDVPLDPPKLANLDDLARVSAAQRPSWKPGTRSGYHAISIGWYVSELLRRIDPKKRSAGRFFAEEVAKPLGVDFLHRVAREHPRRTARADQRGGQGLAAVQDQSEVAALAIRA